MPQSRVSAQSNDLYIRIGHVENTLASMGTSVDTLSKNVEKLNDALTSLANDKRTNWSTLAAWATVLLAIMGIYQNISTEPLRIINEYNSKFISRNIEDIGNMQEDIVMLRERTSNGTNINTIPGGTKSP